MEQEIKEVLFEYASDLELVNLGLSFVVSLTGIILQNPNASFTGAILYDNYINNNNPNGLIRRIN